MKLCCVENCNEPCVKGRRYCHNHYLERKRQQYKIKKENDLKTRTLYPCICCNCKKPFEGFLKKSLFCSIECKNTFNTKIHDDNSYIYSVKDYKDNIWEHRNIAERTIGRKLNTDEVVHHLDCNPSNNTLTNLVVLSRGNHGKLHSYLNRQRALMARNDENLEQWKNIIISLTETWLKQYNIEVIKLKDF